MRSPSHPGGQSAGQLKSATLYLHRKSGLRATPSSSPTLLPHSAAAGGGGGGGGGGAARWWTGGGEARWWRVAAHGGSHGWNWWWQLDRRRRHRVGRAQAKCTEPIRTINPGRSFPQFLTFRSTSKSSINWPKEQVGSSSSIPMIWSGGLQRIANDQSQYYVLSYTPPPVARGQLSHAEGEGRPWRNHRPRSQRILQRKVEGHACRKPARKNDGNARNQRDGRKCHRLPCKLRSSTPR